MFGLTYSKDKYTGTAYVLTSELSSSELDAVASGALDLSRDIRTLLFSAASIDIKEVASGRYASSVTTDCVINTARPVRNGIPKAVVVKLTGSRAVQVSSNEFVLSHKYLSRHDEGVTFTFTSGGYLL